MNTQLTHIPIYFSPAACSAVDSISPSPGKPMAAIYSWFEMGIGFSIISPTPASREDLYRAHLPAFVDGVLSCQIPNGFGTRDKNVAQSLLWTVGAMTSAAREAISNGLVACAPVSGFHHAKYDSAAKFCTYNGLMVAACALKVEGLAERVAIIDYTTGMNQIIDPASPGEPGANAA